MRYGNDYAVIMWDSQDPDTCDDAVEAAVILGAEGLKHHYKVEHPDYHVGACLLTRQEVSKDRAQELFDAWVKEYDL